jgi:hypothetical protein
MGAKTIEEILTKLYNEPEDYIKCLYDFRKNFLEIKNREASLQDKLDDSLVNDTLILGQGILMIGGGGLTYQHEEKTKNENVKIDRYLKEIYSAYDKYFNMFKMMAYLYKLKGIDFEKLKKQ